MGEEIKSCKTVKLLGSNISTTPFVGHNSKTINKGNGILTQINNKNENRFNQNIINTNFRLSSNPSVQGITNTHTKKENANNIRQGSKIQSL